MEATHEGKEMAQPRSPHIVPLRDRLKPSMQLGGVAASRRVGRRESIALGVTIPFVLLLSALMAWLALRRRCLNRLVDFCELELDDALIVGTAASPIKGGDGNAEYLRALATHSFSASALYGLAARRVLC